ncbi:HAD family hydrolase [Nocardia sp. NPDC088792]|uniref:HAD family hydrolase n=1 Tax=Nocardia sp. NPDC088792 TaxID=3364332 RepID=UPI0037F6CD70
MIDTSEDIVSRYSAVLFDWDGTLADSHDAHFHALGDAIAPLGMRISWSWYAGRNGRSAEENVLALAREQRIELTEPVADVVERCELSYFRQLERVREIGWVADLARTISGRLPIAVASGGTRKSIEATMRQLGLSDIFDCVITREDVRCGKPEPDIFLCAARELGVTAQSCLVFEDSDDGLLAAARAGMAAVDVRRSEQIRKTDNT